MWSIDLFLICFQNLKLCFNFLLCYTFTPRADFLIHLSDFSFHVADFSLCVLHWVICLILYCLELLVIFYYFFKILPSYVTYSTISFYWGVKELWSFGTMILLWCLMLLIFLSLWHAQLSLLLQPWGMVETGRCMFPTKVSFSRQLYSELQILILWVLRGVSQSKLYTHKEKLPMEENCTRLHGK